MKLRLRSLESRETQRLEIPSQCTLQQLKQIIAQSISSPPSSSLHISLNRKDELQAPSTETSLQSLGVTSGDLIYYSLNPSAFVSVQDSTIQEPPQTLVQIEEPKAKEPVVGQENQDPPARLTTQEVPVTESMEISEEPISKDVEGNLNFDRTRKMEQIEEVDMDINDDSLGKKMSEPYFLRRVLREELRDDASAHKLVVIAVHAVLLESGFVGFDSVSGKRLERFFLPDDWPSISLLYTLPELLDNGSDNVIEFVVLKFQSLGHFVNVYGCLGKGDSRLHRVYLDEYKFAPIIDLVWTNYDDKSCNLEGKGESKNLCPENDVFEFWKMVKDGLALPLLIDLCEKTGLSLPACLMRLPTELKIKILEYLPGVDIAKMGCVCSEIRYLASSDDLWKKKFAEEFGLGSFSPGLHNWRARFASHWEASKKSKRRAITPWYRRVAWPFHVPIIRDPYPLGVPPMIGVDHERLPGPGIPFPFGQPSGPSHQPFGRYIGRRGFSPKCNLGGI